MCLRSPSCPWRPRAGGPWSRRSRVQGRRRGRDGGHDGPCPGAHRPGIRRRRDSQLRPARNRDRGQFVVLGSGAAERAAEDFQGGSEELDNGAHEGGGNGRSSAGRAPAARRARAGCHGPRSRDPGAGPPMGFRMRRNARRGAAETGPGVTAASDVHGAGRRSANPCPRPSCKQAVPMKPALARRKARPRKAAERTVDAFGKSGGTILPPVPPQECGTRVDATGYASGRPDPAPRRRA